ncbi:sigma-70 family RNA polymerase sigma factor [Oryzihumus leptocrescens]|uniref:RNA polymerase sigma-B factor n=1 Tax=Oryzihumus leptocrescens TaxID=297536 RepID=A0A542ZGU7_9MICO|nr:sigma-70 family RNA polymerase sigma factor [Oryzihumus leptocrescens]TQL59546.1 RNA polymerase sigma-B factor [Oryzihumus leptocrescens]
MTALLTICCPTSARTREAGTDAAGTREARTRQLLDLLAHEQDPRVCREIRDEVVCCNLDVACAIAARYRGRGLEPDDLRQVAMVGLVKAAQRFHAGAGDSFLAFARPTILGEIRRHFRDAGWAVRPPRRLQELHADIRAVAGTLEQGLGAPPSTTQLADALGTDERWVAEARGLPGCYSPTSLDAKRDEHQRALGDELPDPGGDPSAIVVQRLALTTALRTLDAADLRLLRLRFEEELSQEEIGRRLGVSQMQVSRRLRRVLGRLRDELEAA